MANIYFEPTPQEIEEVVYRLAPRLYEAIQNRSGGQQSVIIEIWLPQMKFAGLPVSIRQRQGSELVKCPKCGGKGTMPCGLGLAASQ